MLFLFDSSFLFIITVNISILNFFDSMIHFPELLQSFESQFLCPITHMPIKQPVITQDGHTYQRIAITEWLINNPKSPKTGLYLKSIKLIPNLAFKSINQKHKSLISQMKSHEKNMMQFIYELIKQHINENTSILETIKQMQMQSSNKKCFDQDLAQTMIQNIQSSIQTKNEQLKCIKEQINRNLYSGQINKSSNNNPSNQRQQVFVTLDKQLHKQYSNMCNSDQINITTSNRFQQPSIPLQQVQFQNVPSLQNLNQSILHHHFQYLYNTFKCQKNIKARYNKNQLTQQATLFHQRVKIDFTQFLKYDWSHLQAFHLMECQLGDNQWRVLVLHSDRFPNLKEIRIYANNITHLEQGDLQRFHSMKSIWFYTYGGWSNPLTQQSKNYLKNYKLNNPFMQIRYQE